MGYCTICSRFIQAEGLCDTCRTSVFQVGELLRAYLESDMQPEWIENAIRELSWLLVEHPFTAAFFNTAEEVLHCFLLDQADKIDIEDLKEFNYTTLPRDSVVDVLKRAQVIEVEGTSITPGKLTRNLIRTKWAGYELADVSFEKEMLEYRGVLTMAIVWSLLQDERFIPRRVMSVLAIFSSLILSDVDPHTVDEVTFNGAMRGLTPRQQHRIKNYMAGFKDGRAKVIQDITDEGDIVLKPEMVEYVLRMRERIRERERADRLAS